jgi:hypothetical protein
MMGGRIYFYILDKGKAVVVKTNPVYEARGGANPHRVLLFTAGAQSAGLRY